MKQVERVFVLHLNLVLCFLFRLVLNLFMAKGQKFPFAICSLSVWLHRNVFTLWPSRTTRGSGTLAVPGPTLKSCWGSVLQGLCRVERAVGGKSASPFTTFSTQHGRHTLDYGTSPRIELVLNAWGWVPRIGTFWGTCKWNFFIRVGTVTSQCLLHCF